VLSGIFLLTGGIFGVLGGVGLLRFPDFYTRLHAAGITDTLCAFLIIAGLLLQTGMALVSLKLLLILLFMIFTSPTASHALARAGLAAGVVPFTREPVTDSSAVTGDPSSKP
jgi:multicomponent Na+:H+ antiporter subunit G